MTNDEGIKEMTKNEEPSGRIGEGFFVIGIWSLIRHSSFVIRHFIQ
jgi:hypothetical protein